MEAIAEENRKDIIERLLKGRQERVRKGMFPGGNLPYGYVRKSRSVVIDKQEAEIVRRIYVLASAKHSGQNIADILNGRYYRRRNGKLWTQRQVCRILHRESLYHRGLLHYGNTTGVNHSLAIIPANLF
jgi:site-specific DNA recombinase